MKQFGRKENKARDGTKLKVWIWASLNAMGFGRQGNTYWDYERAKKYFSPEDHKYIAEYLNV